MLLFRFTEFLGELDIVPPLVLSKESSVTEGEYLYLGSNPGGADLTFSSSLIS